MQTNITLILLIRIFLSQRRGFDLRFDLRCDTSSMRSWLYLLPVIKLSGNKYNQFLETLQVNPAPQNQMVQEPSRWKSKKRTKVKNPGWSSKDYRHGVIFIASMPTYAKVADHFLFE
jgi:hypothetical protein